MYQNILNLKKKIKKEINSFKNLDRSLSPTICVLMQLFLIFQQVNFQYYATMYIVEATILITFMFILIDVSVL